jgi:hypothetical protein
MDYWFSGSHEMFPPSELLDQAQAAAQAGFDYPAVMGSRERRRPHGHDSHLCRPRPPVSARRPRLTPRRCPLAPHA